MITMAPHDPPSPADDLASWVDAARSKHDPKVEDYLEGDRYVIRVDIPGVDPDRDIQLTLVEGMLHLSGERRSESHPRRRAEICYGEFERLIAVPAGTRPEAIKAEYADGVLTVSLPAVVPSEPHAIPVIRAEHLATLRRARGLG